MNRLIEKEKGLGRSLQLLMLSASNSLLDAFPTFFKHAFIPFLFGNKSIKDTLKWTTTIYLFSNVKEIIVYQRHFSQCLRRAQVFSLLFRHMMCPLKVLILIFKKYDLLLIYLDIRIYSLRHYSLLIRNITLLSHLHRISHQSFQLGSCILAGGYFNVKKFWCLEMLECYSLTRRKSKLKNLRR